MTAVLGIKSPEFFAIPTKEIEEPLIANRLVLRNPPIKITHLLLDSPVFDTMFVLIGELRWPDVLKLREHYHLALVGGYLKVGPRP